MNTRSSPNRQTLIRLAERAGIDNYETLSKSDLYNRISEKYNYERLMRAEARANRNQEVMKKKRKFSTMSSSTSSSCSSNSYPPSGSSSSTSLDELGQQTSTSSSTSVPLKSDGKAFPSSPPEKGPRAKKPKLNTLDPIMLNPIGKKKTFKFQRPNGSLIQYNVDSLIDYLITSGDFQDPITRIPFTDEQLLEIDSLAKEIGLTKNSVIEAKKNEIQYSETKFRRDALLGLERCAGEVITDILELIEEADPEEVQMQLAMSEFPSFVDYFRQIRDVDADYASKCIAHWKLFLVGPPNCPNQDDYGLIKLVVNFLKNCDEGKF